MKIIFAIALFVVGASALPKFNTQIDLNNERLITDSIAGAIADASQAIKDAGLDPLYISSATRTYELPVPVIFGISGIIEELLFHGLSNIIITNLNYSIITNRLTFDVYLPLIETTLKKAETEVVFFGKIYYASAAGRLALVNLRVSGNVRVSIGVISGISLRSIDIDFSVGRIESDLNVFGLNSDLSDVLNTFLGTTVPNTLNEFKNEINELIEIVAAQIIEANL